MKHEQLTAWALNELSADERAELEALIAADPESKQQAADVRNFCQFLGEHLVDADAGLTDEQRAKLLALQVPAADNVVAFDASAEPAKLNGKVAHAKLIHEANQRHKPNILLRMVALAACLAVTAFIIWSSRSADDAKPVALKQEPVFTFSDDVVVASSDDVKVGQVREEKAKKADVVLDGRLLAKADMGKTSPLEPAKPALRKMVASPVPAALPDPQANMQIAASNPTGLVTVGDTASSPVLPGWSQPPPIPGDLKPMEQQSLGNGTHTYGFANNASFLGGDVTVSDSAVTMAPAPASGLKKSKSEVRTRTVEFKPAAGAFDKVTSMPADRESSLARARTDTGERYTAIVENRFMEPARDPLSTFSIDVDSASYANVRRFLNEGSLPPPDAVRIEELVNYFPYNYEPPAKEAAQPFAVQVDMAEAPWDTTHRIARIGIKGREIGMDRKQANFVFLVDVSGSMNEPNKLPLVQRSLSMLTRQLKEDDHVAIVTYAGNTSVALESTPGADHEKIVNAVNALGAGGSTNGAGGITLAYEQAQKNFIKEGVNRVILCTDGDFNVGISSPEELEKLIKQKAQGGVFLSVLGFGTGNLQDRTMETLADKGNGNYAYIDSLSEARKVLVEQMNGTLVTIAKDVKIQVEFNPAQVRSYRLLGYENRVMAKEDFNSDRKDAGEIGAGHTVTALYEVVPMDAPMPDNRPLVDDLKYQTKEDKKIPNLTGMAPQAKLEGLNDEVMTVKLRYKEPEGQLSKLIEVPVKDKHTKIQDAAKDFQFASAVAGFGLMLRNSEHKGELTWDQVRKLAINGKGDDKLGYRGEFIQLIDKANGLSGAP